MILSLADRLISSPSRGSLVLDSSALHLQEGDF